MAVIETTTFRLADGVDDAAFLEADEQARTGFLYHQAGVIRATTARADDGEWILVVLWASYEDGSRVRAALSLSRIDGNQSRTIVFVRDITAEVERVDPAMDRLTHMMVGAERRRYSTFD